MTMGLMTGCSGKSSEKSESNDDKITLNAISFMGEDTKRNGFNKVIEAYEKANPGVEIKIQNLDYGTFTTTLQTRIGANDAPDLIFGTAILNQELVKSGQIEILNDYDILDQFTEDQLSCMTIEGNTYGVPLDRMVICAFYNKDMFEEVGLDPEAPPQTWDELKEYAAKLSIPDERWGFEMPIDAWFYEAFIMQSDGRILNEDETDIGFNNETGTEPLAMWKSMISEGIMKAPPGKEYNSYEAARSDFSAGITGMIVTSSGDLGTLNSSCDFEVGTAFLPKNTRFGVPTGGANVVMMAGLEEDSAATMDFLKYLTSPEVAAYWATKTGYVPSSQAAADTDVYQEYISANGNAKTALEQMQYTDIPRPINEDYPQIHSEIMMTEIQRCIEEPSYTPEQAVTAISEQTKALLAK